MGAEDIRRQQPNVQRMKLLGARVESGRRRGEDLKEAASAAIRDWVTNVATPTTCLGSASARRRTRRSCATCSALIGDEGAEEIQRRTGRLPDRVVACVGGGSNAIGMFTAFVPDEDVALIGVEAAGEGLTADATARR
jgi:tryptophan synthase beta chain